ncbi:hypothetical protein [Clostridium tarantellae]|uniref:Uncharacterized protein n=1 Tax=Clostridium tarantellae TaxID=39493 RepID=A0A6I1MMP7_9CLOT|nr:hypothetical protein [Clostridium tarantellae]MPQ44294.1 hypothetical protein [Clostridium tarantellae]
METIELKEKVNIKVEELKYRFNKIGSLPYYIFCGIFVIGIIFFLTSNMIFNKEFSLMSTELNKKMYINSNGIELTNRQFNPNNGLIQLNFKVENTDLINENNFKVEIREKSNPLEVINSNLVKISNTDYIVYTYLPKKWSAVSLTVIDETINSSSGNMVKFYSDIRDIHINNKLSEKSKENYMIEIIEQDIKEIKTKVEIIEENIKEKNLFIQNLKDKINNIEKDKKYQTETEVASTEGSITSLNTSIETIKKEIEKLNINKDELKRKVEKLEEKKFDLTN